MQLDTIGNASTDKWPEDSLQIKFSNSPSVWPHAQFYLLLGSLCEHSNVRQTILLLSSKHRRVAFFSSFSRTFFFPFEHKKKLKLSNVTNIMICLLMITNKPLSFVFVLETLAAFGTGHTCPELINRNYQCSLGRCPLNFLYIKWTLAYSIKW